MKETKPKFLLTSVYEDGTEEEPQVVQLTDVIQDAKMNRRGFLGAGLTTSAAVLWLTGCEPNDEPEPNLEPVVDAFEPDPESPNSVSVENAINCDDIFALSSHLYSSLVISPDGKSFYSGSSDGIKIWSLPEGAYIRKIGSSGSLIYSLAVSIDGKQLFFGDGNYLKIWSLSDGKLVKTQDQSVTINALTVSPDGRYFIVGQDDRESHDSIQIYSMSDITNTISIHDKRVISLAVTPDSRYFFSGDHDGAIKKWSLPDGKLVKTWRKGGNLIQALAITPDGKWLLAGSYNGNIKMLNILDGIVTKVIKAHDNIVNTIAITPDGKHFLSGSTDKTIKLWSLPDLILKKTYMQNSAISSLCVSTDGKLLISSSYDKTIKLWKLPELSFVNCLLDLECSENTVKGVTYSVVDESGRTVTYTLPCGSTLPAGSKCICNCVPGSLCSCDSHISCSCQSYSYCSCQSYGTVCTCFTICTCVPVFR